MLFRSTVQQWHADLRARPDGLWDLTVLKPAHDEGVMGFETLDPRVEQFASAPWARFFRESEAVCRFDSLYAGELGVSVVGYAMTPGDVRAAMRAVRNLVESQVMALRGFRSDNPHYAEEGWGDGPSRAEALEEVRRDNLREFRYC